MVCERATRHNRFIETMSANAADQCRQWDTRTISFETRNANIWGSDFGQSASRRDTAGNSSFNSIWFVQLILNENRFVLATFQAARTIKSAAIKRNGHVLHELLLNEMLDPSADFIKMPRIGCGSSLGTD